MNFEWLRQNYLDQPHEIALETLALCNAACTFCPYPTIERKGTRMPDEMIERLVGEMATFKVPFYVSPFKLSDPLLEKRLGALCRMLNAAVPLAQIRIFTNGSALTDEKAAEIGALSNITHLWISLNEHNADRYEKLMALPFARTVRRIDRLHAMAFPHPVVISKVGPDEGFSAYVKERWPKFMPVLIKRDAWINFTDAQYPTVGDRPCGRWFELSIMATGIASLCCMTADEKFSIGDVNKQTLLEIYNAPFYRERREQLLSRKALDERSPCATCAY